jgi:Na+-transporting NADH:ubiquinone oxidoreductase subunit C
MNKNSNTYIITYSTIMVVVVAAVLAIAAMVLGPVQSLNIERETKGALLASVGMTVPTAEIEKAYADYITELTVDGPDGAKLPIYESTAHGKHLFRLPVSGSGLWGPVWGYVALEGDWNTISGVVFDHKGETPGLGAEIAAPIFEDQFKGKKLFEGSELVSITVLKGSGASRGNDHAVDAISGGTITSRAVENMIRATLEKYLPYIEQQRNKAAGEAHSSAESAAEVETINTQEDESVQE